MKAFLFLLLSIFSCLSHAQMTSYHLAHPMGWMYFLPTGETPGWKTQQWINLEFSESNTFNRYGKFTNKRTGDTIEYEADYEQSSLILEGGYAFTDDLMVALEIPISYRGGGVLDNGIDEFHQLIESDRFLRQTEAARRTQFNITTNGEQRLRTNYFSGILSTTKSKIKYRIIPWEKEYGLSVSGQLKSSFGARNGFNSGGTDLSFLIHLGAPLWNHSGIWFTSAFTKISPNPIFYDWSTRQWLQMYELALDLALNEHLGFLAFYRMESPLLNAGEFEYQYTQSTPKSQIEERVASSWNSLMYWRGSQGVGGRYRWDGGDQLNFLMIEDWSYGGYDKRQSFFYVNNAPDVAFVVQLHYAL